MFKCQNYGELTPPKFSATTWMEACHCIHVHLHLRVRVAVEQTEMTAFVSKQSASANEYDYGVYSSDFRKIF